MGDIGSPGAVVAVGVDLVSVERFAAVLARTPSVGPRLLTDAERAGRDVASLAARFAAKEALAKALGAPGGLRWHDAEVVTGEHGEPGLVVRGTVAEAAARRGIAGWRVSLSHDGGLAVAFVVGVA